MSPRLVLRRQDAVCGFFEWEQRARADRARDELQAAFGGVLQPDAMGERDLHEVARIIP